MQWDLYCRVVDNHGDIGVCWRLAADLASRGERVRLTVDDATALAWMAPAGVAGVNVLPWPGDAAAPPSGAPADVVVEAFGCDPPASAVRRMASRAPPPVWINLEYLSAEPYVERSHGLPSPQLAGPGAGLTKWFYYPGFTTAAGGLLREPALLPDLQGFDAAGWLAERGWAARAGERVVSLFCYSNEALPALLTELGREPTLLLVAAGAAAQQVAGMLENGTHHDALRVQFLPLLSQTEYDRVLWASDLNFVRGEDSFVRAQWAGRPFVWQIYAQPDGAHGAKLEAFLHRLLAGAEPQFAEAVRRLHEFWNGLLPGRDQPPMLPEAAPWRAQVGRWRQALSSQPDLVTGLLEFVAKKS